MFKKLVTTTALAAAMAVGAFTYGTQAKADDISKQPFAHYVNSADKHGRSCSAG